MGHPTARCYGYARNGIIRVTSHELHGVLDDPWLDCVLNSMFGLTKKNHRLLVKDRWPLDSSPNGPAIKWTYSYDYVILFISHRQNIRRRSVTTHIAKWGQETMVSIIKLIFLFENCCMLIRITLKYVPGFQLTIQQHWFWIIAFVSDRRQAIIPMIYMPNLLTHICVARSHAVYMDTEEIVT